MRRIVIILVLFATATCGVQAQTFRDRLVQIREAYDTMDAVHLVMSIKAFDNERVSKPFFEQVADVKKDHNNYRYEMATTQMLMNSKYIIVTDLNSREIVCSKRSLEKEKKLFDPIKFNLDSILSLYQPPTVFPSEGGLEHYRMEQSKGPIKFIDLFIDVATNRLKKMEYRYTDEHYVLLEFTAFDTNPVFEAGTFDEKHYVIGEKGGLRASANFRGYRVTMKDK